MSLAQTYLDQTLELDVESYPPSRLALGEASIVENWRIELAYKTTEGPSSILVEDAMVLTGRVERSGGELVATTRLIWLDRKDSWARTRDGLYRLGQQATSS
jgi:hypothetical protein